MAVLAKAREPFHFYTRLNLTELTGLQAANLAQLARQLRKVPPSSIYYHTHNFIQQHEYLTPEPASDLSFWIKDVLSEDELGEQIAGIDITQFTSLDNLRQELIKTITGYLKTKPSAKKKFASPGEEFHFMKSISFVLPAEFTVTDLAELAEALDKVTLDSIYFHVFEARLRLERSTNDFSYWLETSLDEKKLADRIAALDPYSYTLEELRKILIKIIKRRILG